MTKFSFDGASWSEFGRNFLPLPKDHPALGMPCGLCGRGFREGELICMVVRDSRPLEPVTVHTLEMEQLAREQAQH